MKKIYELKPIMKTGEVLVFIGNNDFTFGIDQKTVEGNAIPFLNPELMDKLRVAARIALETNQKQIVEQGENEENKNLSTSGICKKCQSYCFGDCADI